MERELIFDGVSSLQIGLIVDGYFSRGIATRRVSKKPIPGHSGDFLIDEKAYDNLNEPYKVYWIASDIPQDNDAAFQRVVTWLKQGDYYRLEDSEYPGYYWMAQTSGITQKDIVNHRNCYYSTTIIFDRKPQCYLKSGESPVQVSSGSVIVNQTQEIAEPLIKLTLADSGVLTINGNNNEFNDFSGEVTIDCERQHCYSGFTDLASNMTGEFPVLNPGENTISFTGGISDLQIIPRWWTR